MVVQSKREETPAVKSSDAAGLFSIIKQTGADWLQDNAMRLAAALSLYTILSLAPLLVISLKIISVVWKNKQAVQESFNNQITFLMGPEAASAIQNMLENGGKHGQGIAATVTSLVVLVFSATGVFAELQDSMNTIWGVKPKPNQGIWGFIRNRLLSMGMVFGIAFLLLVSMFVSTMLTALATYFAGNAKWLAVPLDIMVSFGVVTVLFAAIFKFLPDVKIAWRQVWLGAVLTAGLFIVGKYGLALYFKYATPTSAFGAAGSLAAVLLWVYYSSFILFFGAEFTKVWSLHHGSRLVPAENAVKVTEEDRAQRGIPSERRMNQALEGHLPSSAKNVRYSSGSYRHRDAGADALSYAITAAAVAVGYGARCLVEKRNRNAAKIIATEVKARVNGIEGRLGELSRISQIAKSGHVRANK